MVILVALIQHKRENGSGCRHPAVCKNESKIFGMNKSINGTEVCLRLKMNSAVISLSQNRTVLLATYMFI